MSPPEPALRVLAAAPAVAAGALTRLACARDGLELVDLCPPDAAPAGVARLRPGLAVVVLDPAGAGLRAIEAVMCATPAPILAVCDDAGSAAAKAALAAGALEVVAWRALGLDDVRGPVARAARARMRLLARVPVIRHPRGPRGGPATTCAGGGVVGIVSSTGGPQALALLLARLPADFPLPVVVVQHMAAGFVAGMAEWLDRLTPLPVRLATGDHLAAPGVVIAPDGVHLAVGPGLELRRPATEAPHRPSGDVLLTSLARALGDRATAVVLTGMGRDGAEGLRAVRAAGGLTLAQDPRSAAVAGMPRAAAAAGAAAALPPEAIGARLACLAAAAAR